jgi:hypothetical protein
VSSCASGHSVASSPLVQHLALIGRMRVRSFAVHLSASQKPFRERVSADWHARLYCAVTYH